MPSFLLTFTGAFLCGVGDALIGSHDASRWPPLPPWLRWPHPKAEADEADNADKPAEADQPASISPAEVPAEATGMAKDQPHVGQKANQNVTHHTNPIHHLAFIHVPFNFGHTIEEIGLFGAGRNSRQKYLDFTDGSDVIVGSEHRDFHWSDFEHTKYPILSVSQGREVWGHLHPDLQSISEVTGCPLYYTPPKHWPRSVAEKYLGHGRKRFGVLRNPTERLVSMFRGNFDTYGGTGNHFHRGCAVDRGVKALMKRYLSGSDPYMSQCTMVPQSEYFEGEFGIEEDMAIDNYEFPHSMNRAFVKHGVFDRNITQEHILHVSTCENSWARHLSQETKNLILQAYRSDFDLICRLFGRCNVEEALCLPYVEGMCPPNEFWFDWNEEYPKYKPLDPRKGKKPRRRRPKRRRRR